MSVNYHVVGFREEPRDWFNYLVDLRPTPITWNNLAVNSMDLLRRADSFRPRVYCVPSEVTQTLPAYDRIEAEVPMEPGSWLWLMGLANTSGGALGTLSIQVTDVASGVPLCKYHAAGTLCGPNASTRVFLPEPKLVTGQGLLAVEVCNFSGSAYTGLELSLFLACPIMDARSKYGYAGEVPAGVLR